MKYLLYLVICLLLLGCSTHNVSPGDKDYPVKNLNPKNFFLFHGTIDPSLDIKFKIRWDAMNPECKYMVSVLEGASNNFAAAEPLEISRSGNQFSVRVATDSVNPGRCGWMFGGITFYSTSSTGYGQSLIQTNSYPLRPEQSPDSSIKLRCKLRPIPSVNPLGRGLVCQSLSKKEHGVVGTVVWWHPETKDVEVQFYQDKD